MEAVVQVVLQGMWFDTTNSCNKSNKLFFQFFSSLCLLEGGSY